jgi:glutathione S-transferase
MSEYQLYCFAQSGNAYRAALMLNLIGAEWKPVWIDFFGVGVQRSADYRADVNVILTYLARKTGKFLPQGEDQELESLRWIIFDNQKINGFLGPMRFLINYANPAGDPAVIGFLKGRALANLGIVNKRLEKSPFLIADNPTIADISMTGYLYYPVEELGFDIAKDFPAIGAWLKRLKALPGWKHPYDLMPGYPLGTQGHRNQ